jgi:hypothetical protein
MGGGHLGMKQNAPGGGWQRQVIILAALVLLAARPAVAQYTITLVSSDWSLSAGPADLTLPPPGSDFASSWRQWDASDALLNITAGNASAWNVTAHLRVPAGQSWPAALQVYVIRTGDGTCTGTCGGAQIGGPLNSPLGPLPREPLGATPATPFFDGKRSRINVPIKLRIEGLTATIPAGAYQVEVVYTVQ